MRKLGVLLLVLCLVPCLVSAESTLELLDQALTALGDLERNNQDLQRLLRERDSTIQESERSLLQIQQQSQNLERSLNYYASKNKTSRVVIGVLIVVAVVEGLVLALR